MNVEVSRPYMPGYGVLGPSDGTGLLPWSWAQERLTASHDYWLATVRPDGRPHVMPVWAVWADGVLDFSSAAGSRKVRNLVAAPACTMTTDDALDPVVVEGTARVVPDQESRQRFLDRMNAKYATSLGLDFLDGVGSVLVRLTPQMAFGLRHDDFVGSPTRWRLRP